MASSKDIAAVPEAETLYRETAQIVFGLQNGAIEREERRKQKEVDKKRNPDTQYQPKKGDRVGLATQAQKKSGRDPIANAVAQSPKTVAKNLHEMNKAQGKKEGQYYKSTVDGFKIKSLNSNNITVTRRGERKAAFRRVNGRVQVNKLTRGEKKRIAIFHGTQVKKDRGVSRGV